MMKADTKTSVSLLQFSEVRRSLPTPSINAMERKARTRGVTLIELVIIATIVLIVGGITIPYFLQFSSNLKLLAATHEISDFMQRARMMAAKNNAVYPVRFQTNNSLQQAWIDLNNDGALDSGDPYIDLPSGVTAASGAPGGTGGQPSAYTLVGDTSAGTPFDNSNVLAYSPRGLPCNYSGGACSTPAASYFVLYFKDTRPNGWSGVVVTKSGRSKSLIWNGSAWR